MKREIADTAQRLFRAQGYGAVSMRKIAKEIGCTPMALYSYYDGKIDILRSLWGGVFDDVFKKLKRVRRKTDPVARLTALSTAYVAYWLDHTDHYRLVFMADGVSQPEVSLFLDRQDIAAQFSIFADAIADAGAGPSDPAALKLKLDTLICLLHGIAHNHITISGYAWSPPGDMVRVALDGVLAA